MNTTVGQGRSMGAMFSSHTRLKTPKSKQPVLAAGVLIWLMLVSVATAARAADDCGATIEVAWVQGTASAVSGAGPGWFNWLCRDDKTLSATGSLNASCSNEGGRAQAGIVVPSVSHIMVISGLATAISATAAAADRAQAQASVQFQVRAVGGAVRISATRSGDGVGLGLPPSVLHEGATQQFDFSIAANRGGAAGREGTETHSGSLTITVAPVNFEPPTTFTWNDSNGGLYSDAANWDPQCSAPPTVDAERSDTAIFGLGTSAVPIAINVGGATAGRWVVTGGIETSGLARLLGSSQTEPSLMVGSGGKLVIRNGDIESIHADVGQGNQEGWVQVSGDHGSWKNSGLMKVGGSPHGRLDVQLAGQVETADLEVGAASGSTGTIEVRDAGVSQSRETLLKVSGTLTIANGQGAGRLSIVDGGRIEAGNVVIADSPLNGADSIVVSGMSPPATGRRSTLLVNGNLTMGGGGAPTRVEIKDGASLLTTAPVSIGTGTVFVNNTASGLPPLDEVTGSGGASWTAQGPIGIGGIGQSAELVIEDGGVVTASEVVVGQVGGTGRGRVTVTDGGSLLFCGDLTVGAGGQGNMFISDGARVNSGASVVGGVTGGGSVEISGLVSSAEWRVRGNLDVGAVGPGLIQLNAVPFVGGATLRVNGMLTVGNNGMVTGNGTLDVPVPNRVVNGGVIQPGLSPGQITIEGDYEQQEGGVLIIEVGGLEPGQFDVLKVTGNATLAGKLQLKFIDGFVPKEGDVIDCLQVGGTTTGQLTVETLDADDQPVQVAATAEMTLDGALRVTITAGSATPDPAATATPGDGTSPVTPPACGGGACGAGVMSMVLTMLGLCSLRAVRRRR